jgi:hypothetical protein
VAAASNGGVKIVSTAASAEMASGEKKYLAVKNGWRSGVALAASRAENGVMASAAGETVVVMKIMASEKRHQHHQHQY